MLYAPAESRAGLETEYTDACGIRPAWADLVDQAGLVDFDLSETKTAFSITTRQQVTLLLLSKWQSDHALLKCLPFTCSPFLYGSQIWHFSGTPTMLPSNCLVGISIMLAVQILYRNHLVLQNVLHIMSLSLTQALL